MNIKPLLVSSRAILILGWGVWSGWQAAGAVVPGTNVPLAAAPVPPSLAVRTIASLRRTGLAEEGALVRVQGKLLDSRPGEYVVVRDDTGTLFAECQSVPLPRVQQDVDLWGELARDGATVRLQHA